MHNMIGGFGSFFILWMLIGMLFCVVVFGRIIWLFARLLNKKTPTMPNTPQPQSPYQTYEQGSQSPQPPQKLIKKVECSTATRRISNHSMSNHKHSTRRNKKCQGSTNAL